MKINLLVVAVLAAVAVLGGCSKTKHANAYGSDNTWWKCNIDPDKGCEGGSLKDLGLTDAEQRYVNEALNTAPWTPAAADAGNVIAHFGSQPNINVGLKLIFDKDARGLCAGCTTSVYLFRGRISMIHWYVPNKFLLIRHDPSVDEQ